MTKIKTLKDAQTFINNFTKFETSVGEFTFKNSTLESEGKTRILRTEDNKTWKIFSFGDNWEDRESKILNNDELKKFVFIHRKDINIVLG